MTSAYPTPMDKLTEQVRAMATEQGAWPSIRQIRQRCNVGHPKATQALEALRTSGFEPSKQDTPSAPVAVLERRLHSVPASTTDDAQADDIDQDQAAVVEQDQADREPVIAAPVAVTAETATVPALAAERAEVVSTVAEPAVTTAPVPVAVDTAPVPPSTAVAASRTPGRWRNVPVYLIALGAFVAIWGGWVGLGEMTGFGPVNLLPGIVDDWSINTAITLPLGMEAYAAFAMRVWFDQSKPARARRFAMWSTCAALVLGMSGQVAYHLMQAAGMTAAPWQITTFVSCLPVLVLGGAAALVHLSHDTTEVQS
ncbi:hypothetical protein SAMN05216188_1462 [Lentzea xinjiangensis]|uniref:Uncharacterized protein n=1 Tax=Lentzea xinjiangensis TaxID=402600 RepID=A0A1H9WVK5_9PSEU|nr:hypothetical protein [Lentzea xinjiangensis]SES37849.1 hypothetical protein SAMN05216188_1462 [Lentzea xinjiangensis]